MQSHKSVRSLDLFTNDLYQFTCSYSYFVQKKHEQQASFQIFFRKYPFNGEYVIFAGLQSVKDFIKELKFTDQHQEYLKKIFPHITKEYFTWIKQDFSKLVTFRSMKQGEIVFANQPILTYSGPLAFVQLLQTPFLNLLGFASLVATNASRMVKAVHPKKCIEFGTRRAQGPDGALSAAQYAFIGGFSATSNVLCSQKLGIDCVGTMSHAYVTSFESLSEVQQFEMNGINMKRRVLQLKKELGFQTHEGQLASFLNFALAFPQNFTTLIDTYSTLKSGLLNTILVGIALKQAGIQKIGIRLDSGDLGQLSKQCRVIWNKYVADLRLNIVASDDLHEERLKEIVQNGSQIDVYAIGTNIATCKKQPALGLVCKLVQLNQIPKMKLSSTPEKATYPSLKKIYRIISQQNQQYDVIALEKQILTLDKPLVVGLIKHADKKTFKLKSIRLLNQQLSLEPKQIAQIKEYCQQSMRELCPELYDLGKPCKHQVYMTQDYLSVFHQTHERAQKILLNSV